MTVNTPSSAIEIKLDMVELKLDRLIDEMRFLKSHTIAFDTRLRGIEAYLKPSEPSASGMTSDGRLLLTPKVIAAVDGRIGVAPFAFPGPLREVVGSAGLIKLLRSA